MEKRKDYPIEIKEKDINTIEYYLSFDPRYFFSDLIGKRDTLFLKEKLKKIQDAASSLEKEYKNILEKYKSEISCFLKIPEKSESLLKNLLKEKNFGQCLDRLLMFG